MNQQKKLKGALIGFDFISSGGHCLPYLQRDDVEIVAVCNSGSDAPANVRHYSDYLDLISKESGSLDFIDIKTPTDDHYKIAKAALQGGLNVLCDNPLCQSVAQAKDLIATAVTHDRVLFPCTEDAFEQFKKAIETNDILNKEIVNAYFCTTLGGSHEIVQS